MKAVYRIVAVIALVGVIFTFIGAKDKIERSKAPINMAEVNWSSLKEGDHIIITIDAVWSRVYKDFMSGSDSEALIAEYEATGRGYIIPRVHESDLGYRYADYVIGIKTDNESYYQALDKIMGETYEWYYDDTRTVGRGFTTLYFEGYLREMTEEEVAYFTEYLRNVCGYSDEQIESKLCPFMMEKREAGFAGVFLTIGLILDVVAVALLTYAMIQNRKGNAIFGKSEYSEVVLHGSDDKSSEKAKPNKSSEMVKVDKSSKKVKSSKTKNSIDLDSGASEVFAEPVKKSSYAKKSIEKSTAYKESGNYLNISSKEERKSEEVSSFHIDSKEENKSESASSFYKNSKEENKSEPANSFYVDDKQNEEEISPLQRKFAETFAKKETVESVDSSSYIEKSVDGETDSYVVSNSNDKKSISKENDTDYVEKSVNEETSSYSTSSSYGGNSGGAYGGSLGGSYGGNSGGAYGGSLGGSYGGGYSDSYGGSYGGGYGDSYGGSYGGSLGGGYGGSLGGGYGGSLGGGYGGSLGGGYGGSLSGGYGGSLGGGAYGGSGGAYGGSGGSGYGGSGYSDSLRERERGFVGAGNQDSSGNGLKQGGVFDDFWKSFE